MSIKWALRVLLAFVVASSLGPTLVASAQQVDDSASPVAYQDEKLEQLIAGQLAGRAGDWGVAVLKLKTGQMALYNPDHVFTPASLFKLAVMYEAFRRRQEGTLSFRGPLGDGRTVADGLHDMITWSDNTSAYIFGNSLLGWSQIEQTMHELGLNGISFTPEAKGTPQDFLVLLQMIATGHAVDAESSQDMLDLLLAQQINDRLPVPLPRGTPVAHKTGNLAGIINDAGIVYAPGGAYIIVVMTENLRSEGEGVEVTRRLSRIVYDHFEGLGGSDLPPQSFPETGQQVGGKFLAYFDAHGGLSQFGYPITGPFPMTSPDGSERTVQYFEMARLEHYPELAGTSGEIQVGDLGKEIAAVRSFPPAGDWLRLGRIYFSRIGHTLGGRFLQFWRGRGGLERFGQPISEPFAEKSFPEGREMWVQYFEKGRLEYDPLSPAGSLGVRIGRMGTEALLLRMWTRFFGLR